MTKKTTIAAFFASLVVALMLAFATTAYAAQPPESTALYIHKHMLTNITDAGDPGTGAVEDNVAGDPLNGVVFKIYRVDTTTSTPAAGKIYMVNGNTLSVIDADGSTVLGTYPVTQQGSVTTADDGTAEMGSFSEGVYVVVEDTGSSAPVNAITGKDVEVNEPCAPFIVSLPMTNADGNDYLSEVHVYPKNGAIVIDKKADITDGNAVVVGSVITYTITSTIPNGIEKSQQYDVTDQLNDALDWTIPSDSYGATVTTLPGGEVLTYGSDYMLSYSDSRLLTVSFTSAGRAKLAGSISVQVEFQATVNDSILSSPDLTVGNDAHLDFTNEKGDKFAADTDGDGPKVHTAGIEVSKLDQNQAPLNGATFKIATSEQNAKDGLFLRLDPSTKVLYDAGTNGWSNLNEGDDYTISPRNTDSFVGLKDKADDAFQSYWIVETVAPTGYNLIATPVEVTFNGSEDGYVAHVDVVNHQGFTLPVTGGMGTILFVAVGIVLLGTAVIIVIAPWKRRKANDIQK